MKNKITDHQHGSAIFIRNYPAMRIGDYLVVADVHLGLTSQLYEAGLSLPSQVKSFVDRLHKLKRLTKAKKLIIVGDLKNRIAGIAPKERAEIPAFLESLNFEKIILVKGNHDAGIEKVIPVRLRSKVKVTKSFELDKYFFTHGHRKIKTK